MNKLHRPILIAGAALGLLVFTGCHSQQSTAQPRAGAVRALQLPAGGNPADADRAALSRFVGVWTFEGWSEANGQRASAAGRAAAVIEDEHFVLIDFQATSGELAGRAGRKSGSMLLASEPGIGLTMTVWGDASPSVGRLTGTASQGGAAFTFNEHRTPPDRRRVDLAVAFESDDRWLLEVREADSGQLVASYRFTRSPK